MRYGVQGSVNKQTLNVSRGVSTEVTITKLNASTNYSIEVAAVNNVGIGKYSAAIFALTQGIVYLDNAQIDIM